VGKNHVLWRTRSIQNTFRQYGRALHEFKCSLYESETHGARSFTSCFVHWRRRDGVLSDVHSYGCRTRAWRVSFANTYSFVSRSHATSREASWACVSSLPIVDLLKPLVRIVGRLRLRLPWTPYVLNWILNMWSSSAASSRICRLSSSMHSSSGDSHCDLMNLEIIGAGCLATGSQSLSSFSLVISFCSPWEPTPSDSWLANAAHRLVENEEVLWSQVWYTTTGAVTSSDTPRICWGHFHPIVLVPDSPFRFTLIRLRWCILGSESSLMRDSGAFKALNEIRCYTRHSPNSSLHLHRGSWTW